MSKIGKSPVVIPEGVSVEIREGVLTASGKNGSLSVPILTDIGVTQNGNELTFTPKDRSKQSVSNWGTMRSLVQNAVTGASENFTKVLLIEGVGYRANIEGDELVLALGYSHPVRYKVPEELTITVEKNTITVAGADKAAVGEAAAKIRSFRKPEPYKGKGIRYSDEVVRRKPGKKAVGAGGA